MGRLADKIFENKGSVYLMAISEKDRFSSRLYSNGTAVERLVKSLSSKSYLKMM